MKKHLCAAVLLFALSSLQPAHASFGSMQVYAPVFIANVFTGHLGAIFIGFSAVPTGCGTVAGGYLTPSWPEANGGQADDVRAARMLANILTARALERPVEVRYRINSAGNGWNNCAIDAIWMK